MPLTQSRWAVWSAGDHLAGLERVSMASCWLDLVESGKTKLHTGQGISLGGRGRGQPAGKVT